MSFIDPTDFQNLPSDLLATIKLFTGIKVPLKNFYIFDEKIALAKFGATSIKTSLGSMAKSFLRYHEEGLCQKGVISFISQCYDETRIM